MHRHILLAVVLLAAALAFQAPLDHAEQTRNAETKLLTVNAKQQLLSSTIQISMLMVDQKNGDGAGNAAYAWRGLGTLVEHDGSQFLLTHGHWPLPSPSLIAVELRDSTGKRLLLLDANAFLKLLRYHDRGTMLIEMSRQFSGVTPATLGNSLDVATGDIVWLAAYDPDAIGAVRIVRTHVEAVDLEAVPARLQLRGPHTAGIALGDSGGGVWADGKLVGNLWSIVATK